MDMIFEIPGRCEITARKPTLAEFLVIADKRDAAYGNGKRPADFMDDGDEEIVKLVTSPTKNEFRELMDEYPTLTTKIFQAMQESPAQVVVERNITDEEVTAFGKKVVILSFLDKRVVLRKISRPAVKILLRESGDKGTLTNASVAQVVREHLISPNKPEILSLFEQDPILCLSVGAKLLQESNITVEVSLKKALTASS